MKMKNITITIIIALLLVTPIISAGALDLKPIEKGEQLDFSAKIYKIKSDGLYENEVKLKTKEEAEVWIDKKVENTYHVDSLVEQDVGVEVYLYYDIQPDTIDYVSHNGKYQQVYTYNDWTWEELEEGGNAILIVNLEYGTGSNTFTDAISGATWVNDGVDVTLTNDADYVVDGDEFTVNNINHAFKEMRLSYSVITDANSTASTIAHLVEIFVALAMLAFILIIVNHYVKEM